MPSVDEGWDALTSRDLSTYPNDLSSLVALASSNAKLRRLFPFLSIGRLCLSQCTEYPFYVRLWIAPLGDGLFSVRRPFVLGGNWVEGNEIARGCATDAVSIAENELPDDLPSAMVGNSESLGL